MANPEKQINQPVTRRRFLVVGAATGLAGGAGFLITNILKYRTPIIPEPSSVAGAQEATTPTAAPTTDIPVPTATLKPVDTATIIPSPTEKPTNTVTAVPTKPATPTPTETVISVEKSPLPEYGVFSGDLLKEDGTKEGMIVIASIPHKDKPEQIFVYSLRDDGSFKYPNAFLADLKGTQNGRFEAVNSKEASYDHASPGTYTLEANWNSSNNALTGKITTKRMGKITEVLNFQITSVVGTGKDRLVEAAKKMKLATGKYGGDWRTVNIDELKKTYHIDLTELP